MKEAVISMPIQRTTIVDGRVVSTFDQRRRYDGVKIEEKDVHEYIHGELDGKPRLITREPGPGYEALTVPGSKDPRVRARAALGPRVILGPKAEASTRHDLNVAQNVARKNGVDLERAAAEAKAHVEKNGHRIMHGARALRVEGTIFEKRFKQLREEADGIKEDKKNGVHPVTIWDRNGNSMTFKAPANDNVVKIPTKYLAAA